MKRSRFHFSKAFIRCDSSDRIGGGHVTRCLALAEILIEQKIPVEFICRRLPSNMTSIIRRAGFKTHLLSMNLTPDQDAEATRRILRRSDKPLVVVDNYALDATWENLISADYHLLTIDDLETRAHSCQMLLNQGALDERERYPLWDTQREKRLLLGPKHVVLRREFRRICQQPLPRRSRQGMTVFFGNYDESGETLKFLKAVRHTKFSPTLNVIVSPVSKHLKELLETEWPRNVKIHVQPKSLSRLFLRSRLFFGSGGTISWERIVCGVPGVIVSVAANQEPQSKGLARKGCQVYLGPSHKVNYEKALPICDRLLSQERELERMAKIGRTLVSALSYKDIAPLAEALWIRPARVSDARFLFDLRREPSVTSASIQRGGFSYRSHVAWLEKRLKQRDSRLFLVMYQGQPVGQVRIDADLTVSISLISAVRGLGLSKRALQLGIGSTVKARMLKRGKYKALIRPENTASVRLFKSVGFKKVGKVEIEKEKFLKFTRL